MRIPHTIFLLAAGLLALSPTGNGGTTVSPVEAPAYDRPVDPDRYRIHPGEQLTLTLLNSPLPKKILEVDAEGRIADPEIGMIATAGLTLAEVRERLAARLGRLYRNAEPVLSAGAPLLVNIRVTGAVARPGRYGAYTSEKVSDVIGRAGGLTEAASRRHILFLGDADTLVVDLERAHRTGDYWADPPLYAGYRVHVPPRTGRVVTVTGAVREPRTVEVLPGEDLAAIIRLAGGLGADADSAWVQAHLNLLDTLRGGVVVIPGRSNHGGGSVGLFGAVARPGWYPAGGGSLMEVIAAAGGVTAHGNRARVVVFRRAEPDALGRAPAARYPLAVPGDEGLKGFRVKAGDSVFVPVKVGYVRVSGAVARPGLYPYIEGNTAGRYVAAAGGVSDDVSGASIKVVDRVTGMSRFGEQAGVMDGDAIIVRVSGESR